MNGTGTCPPYYGSGNLCVVYAQASSTLVLGTAGLPGAKCSGSTYLTLRNPSGYTVASSTSYINGQTTFCSYISYKVSDSGYYTIDEGCYAGCVVQLLVALTA